VPLLPSSRSFRTLLLVTLASAARFDGATQGQLFVALIVCVVFAAKQPTTDVKRRLFPAKQASGSLSLNSNWPPWFALARSPCLSPVALFAIDGIVVIGSFAVASQRFPIGAVASSVGQQARKYRPTVAHLLCELPPFFGFLM
jgi:hypothetical protein